LRARAAIELGSYREEKVHTNTRKSDFYLEKGGMHAAQHQARAEVAFNRSVLGPEQRRKKIRRARKHCAIQAFRARVAGEG
jgi:hypothetical protein